MKVIVLRPHQKACIEEIDNDLASYQKLVGGYIEIIAPFSDGVVLVCNEEGMIIPLPYNMMKLYGTFFVVGTEGDEFRSLTDEEVMACELLINGKVVAKAQGYSKKNAQQQAAERAWADVQSGKLQ